MIKWRRCCKGKVFWGYVCLRLNYKMLSYVAAQVISVRQKGKDYKLHYKLRQTGWHSILLLTPVSHKIKASEFVMLGESRWGVIL